MLRLWFTLALVGAVVSPTVAEEGRLPPLPSPDERRELLYGSKSESLRGMAVGLGCRFEATNRVD